MQKVKEYYDKMVDFKQYAKVLLAISAFFYLGVLIPTVEKNQFEIVVMMVITTVFLAGSVLFLMRSKSYYKKLLESEEGQEFLMNR
ncbi:YrhC family protein [Bacillus tuaregi]|uniref:YrhC family protein n=1 Tax=Bacillus tuaregi TaxID=1816695 RepID=UPI0008F8069E|nr:YrhC family protein [Bacillus tuaregi]